MGLRVWACKAAKIVGGQVIKMESKKLNGGGCEMALDDSNLKVNEIFQDVFEIHYFASDKRCNLQICCVDEKEKEIISNFKLGYKSFSIEGFTHGENAGMIQLKIEK